MNSRDLLVYLLFGLDRPMVRDSESLDGQEECASE